MNLYAAKLILQTTAQIRLKVYDSYAIHRIVMDLFDLNRSPEELYSHVSSGIQWVDKGEHIYGREIQLLSVYPPRAFEFPEDISFAWKKINDDFLEHDLYRFSILVNPCRMQDGKRVGITNESEICAWFNRHANISGFEVKKMEINHPKITKFKKGGRTISYLGVKLNGLLEVRNRNKFKNTFAKGIGKGRAFGYGLLQLSVIK